MFETQKICDAYSYTDFHRFTFNKTHFLRVWQNKMTCDNIKQNFDFPQIIMHNWLTCTIMLEFLWPCVFLCSVTDDAVPYFRKIQKEEQWLYRFPRTPSIYPGHILWVSSLQGWIQEFNLGREGVRSMDWIVSRYLGEKRPKADPIKFNPFRVCKRVGGVGCRGIRHCINC